MKTLMMTAAAALLLVAGTATAGEVDVVVNPESDANIVVKQIETAPVVDPGTGVVLVEPHPDDGMLTIEELENEDPEAVFGFDPDAVIYIRPGGETEIRAD